MLDIKFDQLLGTDVQKHPAVIAWREIQPKSEKPEQIGVIKQKNSSQVYRIANVGPKNTAVIAKRCRSEKAKIERIIYEEFFPNLDLPTPDLYGHLEEQDGNFLWLFFEDIGNQPLMPLISEHRARAAQWIGEMNLTAAISNLKSELPDRGPAYYQKYLQTSQDLISKRIADSHDHNHQNLFRDIHSMCDYLEKHWNQIKNYCSKFPRTIVHGDCLVKNVHVRLRRNAWEVLPFDWAGAGWGLPAADLGQLGLPYKETPSTIPDHQTYLKVVRKTWSSFDLETVENLANLGQLFWSLKVICISLPEFDDREAYIEGLLHNYGVYASVLNSAIRAADWIN
jgi:thiamine kinase-like enzyme